MKLAIGMLGSRQEPSWQEHDSAALHERMAALTQMLLQGAEQLGQGECSDAHYAGIAFLLM